RVASNHSACDERAMLMQPACRRRSCRGTTATLDGEPTMEARFISPESHKGGKLFVIQHVHIAARLGIILAALQFIQKCFVHQVLLLPAHSDAEHDAVVIDLNSK